MSSALRGHEATFIGKFSPKRARLSKLLFTEKVAQRFGMLLGSLSFVFAVLDYFFRGRRADLLSRHRLYFFYGAKSGHLFLLWHCDLLSSPTLHPWEAPRIETVIRDQ